MRRIVLSIIMLVALASSGFAQPQFRTAELERLATALALDAASLPDGYSHPSAKGIVLTVHKTSGTVDHLGRQLFSDELRTQARVPVLDFLERYFLQLRYPPKVKTASMMVRDDEFHFLTGSLSTVDKLLPTDAFSFNYDRHHYQVSWSRKGKTLLELYFPVEYELISGENKIEAENNLQGDILHTQVDLRKEDSRLLEDATYLSDYFSNRLYTHDDGSLVHSSSAPFQSASNIMLSLRASEGYKMDVTQVCYGFKKNVFSVPLQQWIAFCRNSGCELYFGVENISTDGDVKAVVLAVNEQENYNHVLTVLLSARAIERQKGTVEARLYPYVPMHNVEDLFAAYRKSNPKNLASE